MINQPSQTEVKVIVPSAYIDKSKLEASVEFRHFSTLDTFNLEQPLAFQAANSPHHQQKPQTSSLPHRTVLNQPSGSKFSRVTIHDNTRKLGDIYSAAAGTSRTGPLLSGDMLDGFTHEVKQTDEST